MAYLDIKLEDDDIYIDPDTGDVVWIEGAEAIAQHIRCRLRMFKGEWFHNTDEGVPWFDEILEKGISDGRIAGILRQVIEGTPGVLEVTSLVLVRNREERSLAVTFEASTDEGVNIVSTDYGVFEVTT